MATNIFEISGAVSLAGLGSNPSSPSEGILYYNNSSNVLRLYDGSAFVDLLDSGSLSSTSNGEGASLVGVEDAAGNFTGTDVEAVLAELYTAATGPSQETSDLITLSGVPANSTDLGTFTGSTIADGQTTKAALQALETEVESKASQVQVDEIDQNANDLVSLSGVAENSTDLGTFTGSTIPDSSTTKAALQSLETEVETKAADADVIKKDGSVAYTGDQSMGNNKLTNLATPTADTDAATKAYVDSSSAGLDPKESVRAATTANITLSGLQTIDGVTLIADDRVLVKDQTDPIENGIYTAAAGSWTRATDFDGTPANEVSGGAFTFVEQGSTQASNGYVVQADGNVTVDTDAINFVQFSTAGDITAGDGIDKTGNTISVDSSDIAGDGLEDDGSNNLRISAAAAGNGLKGGAGSALAVEPNDFAGSGLEDDGSDNLRIAASAAGTGLTGGAGSALSIDYGTLTGDGLQNDGSALSIDASAIAGSGLEDDGSENLRISAAAAGDGLQGGAGSALSLDLATNSGLQITSGELDTLLAPSSGLTKGASGLAVNLGDFSTDDLSEGANQYFTNERVDDRVNDLLVAGTNITLTYNDAAGSLTIDASDTGLQDIVEDTTPQLGGNLDLNGFVLLNDNKRGANASEFITEKYVHSISIPAGTTTVLSDLTFDSTQFKGQRVEFTVVDGNARKLGALIIAANNGAGVASTTVSIAETGTSTAPTGVTFSAALNGNNVEISATATAGSARTMRADVKIFQD